MTSYRVIESKHPDDTDLPWEYEEAAFFTWVDEVFLEGYKGAEGAPFPTPQEAIDLLADKGYTVVTVIDVANIGNLAHEEAEKQISAGWTEGVMYRGLNIFDVVYNNGAIFSAAEPFIPEENQECYLGYIAEQDRFVVGFDTWPFDEAECCGPATDPDPGKQSVLFFHLTPKGDIISVTPVPDMDRMFYARNLKKLHELYPSLYDIRLD
jgi:hypothetical protein